MTFKVYYTHRTRPDSSFVKRAWYDSDYGTLALELSGSVYAYNDVTFSEYDTLVTAESPGLYYRNNIQGRKNGYRLGPVADLQQEVDVHENVEQYGAVKVQDNSQLVKVFANGGFVRSNGDASLPNVSVGSTVVDEPDLLNTARVPLNKDSVVSVSDNVEYDHTVYFTILDEDNVETAEREHTLKATSVDDATEKMFGLAQLLNQGIVLKGVLVRFE